MADMVLLGEVLGVLFIGMAAWANKLPILQFQEFEI